ncbi:hypothetical protein F8S13_21565 [Chloroflexia bacterium SDU3-3]|nr:hypothetical protein F8S13_21565 [Chloroflexia bacterium SDU3-3]
MHIPHHHISPLILALILALGALGAAALLHAPPPAFSQAASASCGVAQGQGAQRTLVLVDDLPKAQPAAYKVWHLRSGDGGRSWATERWYISRGAGLAGCPRARVAGGAGLWWKPARLGERADDGGLLATDDGGKTWRTIYRGSPVAAAQRISASEGFVASEDGQLLYTADGGQLWDVRTSGVRLAELAFVSARYGYAQRAEGLAFTGDGGRSWRTVETPCAAQGASMARVGATTIFLICRAQPGQQPPALMRSDNAGLRWASIHRPPEQSWQAVTGGAAQVGDMFFLNAYHGWLVVELDGQPRRSALRTTWDGGRTWRTILTTSGSMGGVSFDNSQHGQLWVDASDDGADNPVPMVTADAGRTWLFGDE